MTEIEEGFFAAQDSAQNLVSLQHIFLLGRGKDCKRDSGDKWLELECEMPFFFMLFLG